MTLRQAIASVLTSPTPEGLWELRSRLLEAEVPAQDPIWKIVGEFHRFLDELATRQHVKAWEGELSAVYRAAAWYLYGELWHWAARLKPDLSPAERRQLLDRLLSPALSGETDGTTKAVLLGLLFQVLVLHHLSPYLASAA